MGQTVTFAKGGYVHAEAPGLRGTTVFMGGRSGPTVLGTANVVMASVLAEGVTVIESAACEPEVVDLCDFLNAMGARIHGAGSPTITVTGVPVLAGVVHRVIPDRIEAGTFAVAAVASGGEVTLRGARPDHLGAVLEKLREAGARVERRNGALTVGAGSTLRPLEITTMPYSGFPTDMQAQFMALLCLANGTSIVTERIFESRFMHAAELLRLGADIGIEGPSAIIKGGRPLSGAEVMASDLRASAALVIAGMAAQGRTQVHRVYHLDRGYERMELKLAGLGARIERTQGE
jgi:UDP-N-acetylglucosamine 1-carboxyvinyltransferase